MGKVIALHALAVVFLAGGLANAGQPAGKDQLELKTVSDTPDPFSPSLGVNTVRGDF